MLSFSLSELRPKRYMFVDSMVVMVLSISWMETEVPDGPTRLAQLRACNSSLKADRKQLCSRLDHLRCSSTACYRSGSLLNVRFLSKATRSPVLGSFCA